ncbi:MAG: hypothetical protein M1160_01115 [Candidatus Marsarchaeota archaeon]|nr:hypothetical protein [Candidatus Marsarchaeota archaeon]MCL5111467.1 hypothetical protein [Candidatus Marsarchaeota archaeon]
MAERRVAIKLVGEAKEAYLELEKKVKEEKANGTASSFNQTLFRSINDKIAILKTKCDYGDQIPRKIVLRTKYMRDYSVTNLFRVDLSGYWRMIYTLRQPQRDNPEVDILAIWLDVLDIIDHKKYNKIFGYKDR